MTVFDDIFPGQENGTGADRQEILRFVADLRRPLSAAEISGLLDQCRKFRDISASLNQATFATWSFPQRPLPETYLQFLRWSNDCRFLVNGDRQFGFFSTRDMREMMVAYWFPGHMPEALPFAMNGGGWFYAFDMRNDPVAGEYPVIFTESGVMDFSCAYLLADSFLAALRDGRDPEWLAWGPHEPLPYPTHGTIWLLSVPGGGVKDMFRLKKLLALSWGATEMRNMLAALPTVLLQDGNPYAVWRRLEHEGDLLRVLGYAAATSGEIRPYDAAP